MFYVGLVIGLFIGASIGFVGAALIAAATSTPPQPATAGVRPATAVSAVTDSDSVDTAVCTGGAR